MGVSPEVSGSLRGPVFCAPSSPSSPWYVSVSRGHHIFVHPPRKLGFWVHSALLGSSQDWLSRGSTERGTQPALRPPRLALDREAPLPCCFPRCCRHRRRPLSPTSSLNQVPAGAPSVSTDAHAWVSVPCGLSGGCRETVNPRPVGCYLDFSSSPPSDLCSAFLSPRRAAARTCPGGRAAVAGRNSLEHPAGPGTRSRPLLACASNTPPG